LFFAIVTVIIVIIIWLFVVLFHLITINAIIKIMRVLKKIKMDCEKIISGEIITADFDIVSNELAIHLFVKGVDSKKYLLKDYNFKPYFLLLGENIEVLKKKIEGFDIRINYSQDDKNDNDKNKSEKVGLKNEEIGYVTGIDIVEKRVGLYDKKLLKIYVNSPNSLIRIKDEILKKLSIDRVNEKGKDNIFVFEHDIPFEKRYILDNGLTPFTQYDFVCKIRQKETNDKDNEDSGLSDELLINSTIKVNKGFNGELKDNINSTKKKISVTGDFNDEKYNQKDNIDCFEILRIIKKPDKHQKQKDLEGIKKNTGSSDYSNSIVGSEHNNDNNTNKQSNLGYSLIAFDIETYVSRIDEINPKKDPILMITLVGELNGKEVNKALVSKIIELDKIKKSIKEIEIDKRDIEFFEDEKSMIERFFLIVKEMSPDFLVGYNSDSFDLRFISERTKMLKIKMDFGYLGEKFKESQGNDFFFKIPGIVNFDLYKYLKRAGGRSLNVESYSLNDVSKYLLGEQKIDLDPLELTKYWDDKNQVKILEFVGYCQRDSFLTFKIAKNMLPSLIEQSKILSLLPEDTSRLSFSQLVEWFLIRKSCDWNYLIPNRPDNKEMITRRSKRFEGAFVFQPKPDLYQKIAVFDFRSLYPTIIISHNISPETYNSLNPKDKCIKVPDSKDFFNNDKKGFLSTALDEIISKRIFIKEQIKKIKDKESFEFKLLYAREQTLKTIANSAYGYLGYERARWYCFGCAKAVTAFGRHYIHNVIDSANESGFMVLYSDTDSVFIQLNKKSIDEAKDFVNEINKKLPTGMELEYEGFYKSAIFVFSKGGNEGAKKRYALMDEHGNVTIKGFETIRRNWSNLGKKLQREVLRIILDKNDVKKAIGFVMQTIKDVRERNVELSDFMITTKLTKKISNYSSRGPHVAAAIKMREKGLSVEPGTLIRYIIAKPKNAKNKQRISDNVMLFEDACIDDYDEEYYIEKQLIPAVESIFKTLGKDIDEKKGKQTNLSSF